MRDSTSNGPVRSIWSRPSNSNEPICKCVSCGIMDNSLGDGMDKTNVMAEALAEMPNSPRFPPIACRAHATRIVEVLAYPSVQLLDVTGPLQVFATANDQVMQAGGTAPYDLRVVAKAGKTGEGAHGVTASAGLGIATRPLPRMGALAGFPGFRHHPKI